MGSTRNKRMNSIIRGEEPQARSGDQGRGEAGRQRGAADVETMETPALWEELNNAFKRSAELTAELEKRSGADDDTADVERQTKEIREVEA